MARRLRGVQDTFTGKSGQLATMAELLIRQCNAAMPEVDVGTDVLAFHDEEDDLVRLQVKTAQATRYKKEQGYSAQFSIPLRQLKRPDNPLLYFVFAVRLEGQFVDFLVIRRAQLKAYVDSSQRFGTQDKKNLVLTIQFRQTVLCGEVDLTSHRNAWDILPPLHPSLVDGQNAPHT